MYDALIFGSNGQLGRYLLKTLGNGGMRVIGYDKNSVNLDSTEIIEEILTKDRPRYVVNCVALTDVNFCESNPVLAFETNSNIVDRIALGCNKLGLKFIHISTDFVFDGIDSSQRYHDSPTNPISIYGKSKLLGEGIALNCDKENTTILRTGSLYGGHKSNFVKYIVENVISGNAITLAKDQLNQPTHVGYLSEIIYRIIAKELSLGIFHVTTAGLVSKFDFAVRICELLDLPTTLFTADIYANIKGSEIRPKVSNLVEPRYNLVGLEFIPTWEEQLYSNQESLEKYVKEFQGEL